MHINKLANCEPVTLKLNKESLASDCGTSGEGQLLVIIFKEP